MEVVGGQGSSKSSLLGHLNTLQESTWLELLVGSVVSNLYHTDFSHTEDFGLQ
jgi:ABC-type phosphate/phosphonate transport system ATPase subunit